MTNLDAQPGPATGPGQDQLAAQAHRHHEDTPTRWVPLFCTSTYSDVVVNVDYVVRIMEVADTDFVHVTLVDGTTVEISANTRDHHRLLEAIGQMEVATW